jgi:hypothetical protein
MRLYKKGRGRGQVIHVIGQPPSNPTLTPTAPREPSSPEAQRFLPVRVGYLGGATSGAQGRTT